MTRSQTTIPFHNLTFHDDLPNLRGVERRLTKFLKTSRKKAQRAEIEAGRMTDDDRVYPYDLVADADEQRIKGRAIWFLERQQAASGMQHLSAQNRVRLTALKGGLPGLRFNPLILAGSSGDRKKLLGASPGTPPLGAHDNDRRDG